MMPLAIDLFCGLGGWTDGLLAEDYDVIGFDIERHRYQMVPTVQESATKQEGAALKLGIGRPKGAGFNVANEKAYSDALKQGLCEWQEYPAQLVLQDVLTIHGSQFRNADLIVASPPCQEFSYMAMPWSRAKQIAAALRGQGEFPAVYTGSRTIPQLTALFDACFRIQAEACEAAGRYIPMVVENVRGAQPWVGRAPWNYGSFYLWGDVPALMPFTYRAQKFNPDGTQHPQGSWFAVADSENRGARKNGAIGGSWFPQGNGAKVEGNHGRDGMKVPGFNFHEHEKTGKPGRSFQSAAVDGTKGIRMDGAYRPGQHGRNTGSGSYARKAASAQIAKIPLELSRHIARVYRPAQNTPCNHVRNTDTLSA